MRVIAPVETRVRLGHAAPPAAMQGQWTMDNGRVQTGSGPGLLQHHGPWSMAHRSQVQLTVSLQIGDLCGKYNILFITV